MRIEKFTFNPFQENTYLVIDENKNTVIIDPGCYFKEEKEVIKNFIINNTLHLKAILNTHAHLDHIMGNKFIVDTFQVPIYMHQKAIPTLKMGTTSAALYGLVEFENSPEPSTFLEDDEILTIEGISFSVIFGPGHAPGHVAFYSEANKLVLNGDILFKGSYGRVDLPGGDFETLKSTILDKMFALPEDTLVYTGHGEETTIGSEKKENPILW